MWYDPLTSKARSTTSTPAIPTDATTLPCSHSTIESMPGPINGMQWDSLAGQPVFVGTTCSATASITPFGVPVFINMTYNTLYEGCDPGLPQSSPPTTQQVSADRGTANITPPGMTGNCTPPGNTGNIVYTAPGTAGNDILHITLIWSDGCTATADYTFTVL